MFFRYRQWMGLFALLLLAACAAKTPAGESGMEQQPPGRFAEEEGSEPEVATAEVIEPAGDAAVDADVEAPAKETCDGALDCTLFGVGAVLAAPFWVLGAFLGLVF